MSCCTFMGLDDRNERPRVSANVSSLTKYQTETTKQRKEPFWLVVSVRGHKALAYKPMARQKHHGGQQLTGITGRSYGSLQTHLGDLQVLPPKVPILPHRLTG